MMKPAIWQQKARDNFYISIREIAAGTINLTTQYLVPGSRWSIIYRGRINKVILGQNL